MKNAIKYIISALAAVILLYFSFRGVKWEDFYAGLRFCRWEWIIAAMIAGGISFWVRALRWKKLLSPIDPTITRKVSFNAINISYIANLVLPRIGEFVRCGFITRHSQMVRVNADVPGRSSHVQEHRLASYDKVLGTVVLERSWDVLTMLILVAVMTVSMWGRYGNFFIDKIFKPFSDRLGAGFWIVLLGLAAAFAGALWMLWHFRNRNVVLKKVAGFAKGLWEGIISCMKMKQGWQFIVQTVAVWTLYWFMSYAVLNAVRGMDTSALAPDLATAVSGLAGLGALDALFLMLAGSLSSLVPVPGGFGAFHYIVATALATVYGVPFEIGIIFATLSHESQTVMQIICGSCSYVSESLDVVKE